MNDRSGFEARLTTMLEKYTERAPVEVDAVSMTEAVAAGRKHRPWSFQRRAAWLVLGMMLALVALGAAIAIGSYLLKQRTSPAGGGLLIVAALDVPDGHFANATAMHVFTLDLATGERVSMMDRPLTPDGEYGPATWVKWSPDRTHALVFSTHDGRPLGIVDIASHRLTTLSVPPGFTFPMGDDNVVWGPGSDRIAGTMLYEQRASDRILIFDLRGREVARLAFPAGSNNGVPSWSRDGTSIIVDGAEPTNHANYQRVVLPVDGSATTVLSEPVVGWDFGAELSPDGSTIAYATPYGIAISGAAGGARTLLTTGVVPQEARPMVPLHRFPAWSPDGRHIAFAHTGDEIAGQGIYVVDIDGTNLRQLTAGPDTLPDWSPDGDALLFSRAGDPNQTNTYQSVWMVSATGGQPRLLVAEATADW